VALEACDAEVLPHRPARAARADPLLLFRRRAAANGTVQGHNCDLNRHVCTTRWC